MCKVTDKSVKCRNEILVVSFGTSYPETRKATIGAIEERIDGEFGETFTVRRAFTSQMIINAVHRKEGIRVDNVSEALDMAVHCGIRNVIVQPTHLMKGLEYDKLCRLAEEYSSSFDNIVIGDPLLTSDEDFIRTASALAEADRVRISSNEESGSTRISSNGEPGSTRISSNGKSVHIRTGSKVASENVETDSSTAVVLMGHGTAADSNWIYSKMQSILVSKGMNNYFVGTVEASPSLADVITALNTDDYTRIILRPLMVVAGNHAINDMASHDDPASWYSQLKAAGYDVDTVIEGLGQLQAIRDIYADHVRSAINSMKITQRPNEQ